MGRSEETPVTADDPVLALASERFRILALTPWQRFAIANTLEKLDQLVVLPTGGGKSVCFQLPALLLEGITLVVVPLLSLLKDQERRLRDVKVACEVIRGGQDAAERKKIFGRLEDRTSRIVFTVPEILESEAMVKRLKAVGVSHFVVDEAHCISEWGKTFRPSYLELGKNARALGEPFISAYTATASPRIIEDIDRLLFLGRARVLVSEIPDRPNIFYRVVPALSKNEALLDLVENSEKPLVVFTRSRQGAELSARFLRRRLGTDDAFFYHAGLERQERRRVEEWFFPSRSGILCATSAYGMGIDKPDIRTIIHRDVPPSVEAYVQESGRAGRDSEPAMAILINGWDDSEFRFTLNSPLERARYALMHGYTESIGHCRRKYLLGALGHEIPECQGCDVCAGEVKTKNDELEKAIGFREILAVIGSAPRRYSKRELVALLHGKSNWETRQHDLLGRAGFGLLNTWEREEIEEALEILEAKRNIIAPRRGFFKYRYRILK